MGEADMSRDIAWRLVVYLVQDQLLIFAKARPVLKSPKGPVAVQDVFRRVLENPMPLTEAWHIDIGLEGKQDAQLWISELDTNEVVKNVVDNAIGWTQKGGRVRFLVDAQGERTVLRLEDDGPGIALAEREWSLIGSTERWATSRLGQALTVIVKVIGVASAQKFASTSRTTPSKSVSTARSSLPPHLLDEEPTQILWHEVVVAKSVEYAEFSV